MKKLFYLLFISSVVFGSCTKEGDDVEAVQVTCDCGDSSNGTDSLNITGSLSTIIDPNIIGHWKNTNSLVNLGTFTDFPGYFHVPYTDIDVYFSQNGIVHFNHSYTIGNQNGSSNYFVGHSETYKVIDVGILCINSDIIHYEINNGVFTYYSEQNRDMSFICERVYNSGVEIYFGLSSTFYLDHYYYVSTNSLTKQ